MTSEMPREIFIQSDGVYMYPTAQVDGHKVGYTSYIRSDKVQGLVEALENIADWQAGYCLTGEQCQRISKKALTEWRKENE